MGVVVGINQIQAYIGRVGDEVVASGHVLYRMQAEISGLHASVLTYFLKARYSSSLCAMNLGGFLDDTACPAYSVVLVAPSTTCIGGGAPRWLALRG